MAAGPMVLATVHAWPTALATVGTTPERRNMLPKQFFFSIRFSHGFLAITKCEIRRPVTSKFLKKNLRLAIPNATTLVQRPNFDPPWKLKFAKFRRCRLGRVGGRQEGG